jgi:hypothetical protein
MGAKLICSNKAKVTFHRSSYCHLPYIGLLASHLGCLPPAPHCLHCAVRFVGVDNDHADPLLLLGAGDAGLTAPLMAYPKSFRPNPADTHPDVVAPLCRSGLPQAYGRPHDDQGNEVAIGEAGEIIARGPQIMPGYWRQPGETRNVLRDGWLFTSDIGKKAVNATSGVTLLGIGRLIFGWHLPFHVACRMSL